MTWADSDTAGRPYARQPTPWSIVAGLWLKGAAVVRPFGTARVIHLDAASGSQIAEASCPQAAPTAWPCALSRPTIAHTAASTASWEHTMTCGAEKPAHRRAVGHGLLPQVRRGL